MLNSLSSLCATNISLILLVPALLSFFVKVSASIVLRGPLVAVQVEDVKRGLVLIASEEEDLGAYERCSTCISILAAIGDLLPLLRGLSIVVLPP